MSVKSGKHLRTMLKEVRDGTGPRGVPRVPVRRRAEPVEAQKLVLEVASCPPMLLQP